MNRSIRRIAFGIVFAVAGLPLLAPADDLQSVEAKIVENYSSGDCMDVNAAAASTPATVFRPNIIAIVASCATPEESERLFKIAEARDPHGDLIATLHALTLAKTNPEAAKPQWIRVLMYARSESLRDLARESLSGLSVRKDTLDLSSWTYTAQGKVGAQSHSDAWSQDLPWRRPGSKNSVDADLYLRAQHWIQIGSISATYRFKEEDFPQASTITSTSHEVQLPLALRIGPSEDLTFKPFLTHEEVGGTTVANRYGFGFSGIAYRGQHKQTVTGYIAADRYLMADLTTPHQSHYHFDYQWEWFPSRWLLDLKFQVDNHSAARISKIQISDRASTLGDFNQTHNDLGLNFTLRYGFDRWSLGLLVDGLLRLDTQDSTFTELATGKSLIKRRNDNQLILEPHLTFRALSQLQFYGYFRKSWVSSSIDPSDYGVDRNHNDSVVGIALRTYWSSY